MKSLISNSLGFLIGFILVDYLFRMFLGDMYYQSAKDRYMPIIIGVAILCGTVSMHILSSFLESLIDKSYAKFCAATKVGRAVVLFPFIWGIIVMSYVWMFDPRGSFRTDDLYTLKIIFFPSAVIIFVYFVYNKIIK